MEKTKADIVERLEREVRNLEYETYEHILADCMTKAASEIKRLREELEAADEHAKRLEAVVEKMTVWEADEINTDQSSVKWWVESKGGRLG